MSIISQEHMRQGAHALGLDSYGSGAFELDFCRNYFQTGGESKIWNDMVAAGLATYRALSEWTYGEGAAVFYLTEAGKAAVIDYMSTAKRDRGTWSMLEGCEP